MMEHNYQYKPRTVQAVQWDGSEAAWNALVDMGVHPTQTEEMGSEIAVSLQVDRNGQYVKLGWWVVRDVGYLLAYSEDAFSVYFDKIIAPPPAGAER